MEIEDSGTELSKILANSRSSDNATRVSAIPELGRYIDQRSARDRLEQIMVEDEIVTMRVDAAEQLARYGGESGLLAVLNELGRRSKDSDIDYTAYMLSELDNFGEFPVLSKAMSIDKTLMSPDAEIGLQNLRELMQQ
ncbi:hypothetical protein [Nocardia iowensis]|uniref:HEAT repeat domain-containing protein n=1 Tax=Nocardia iowensis TaxID=204891 RepID=A0ABX8RS35_NOCIO|nr:hypothetical protein [Nocardia iowensis]QXN92448.1 hypothetical protein KV110_04665 [Nocardia iowensis]